MLRLTVSGRSQFHCLLLMAISVTEVSGSALPEDGPLLYSIKPEERQFRLADECWRPTNGADRIRVVTLAQALEPPWPRQEEARMHMENDWRMLPQLDSEGNIDMGLDEAMKQEEGPDEYTSRWDGHDIDIPGPGDDEDAEEEEDEMVSCLIDVSVHLRF